MRRSLCTISTLGAALAIAGCGGGGTTAPLPSNVTHTSAQTTIRVRIPGAMTTSASGTRSAAYVSRSTQGIGVSFVTTTTPPAAFPSSTTPAVAADVSPSSSACIANSDGSRSCSIAVPAAPGTDDFQVTAWDAAPVSGSFANAHTLSGATVLAQTIASGQQNTLSFTLDGAVSGILVAVSPAVLALQPAASPAETASVTVNATDYQGDIIMGSGNYTDASGAPLTITLAQSGVNGGPLLTTFPGSSPGPMTVTPTTGPISITYPGGTTSGTVFTAKTSVPIAGLNAPGTLTIR